MNRVTNAERNQILERARQITSLNADSAVVNRDQTVKEIMQEFDISEMRAMSAVGKAARQLRRPD